MNFVRRVLLLPVRMKPKHAPNAKKTNGTALPFIPISPIGLDLRNIQKSIRLPFTKDRLCKECNGKCIVKKTYNNIIALEVEPSTTVKHQKKIFIQHLTPTILIEKEFYLYAVIEFDPVLRHFKSHVKRKHQNWKTYDDIPSTQIDTVESVVEKEEMLPYMLLYVRKELDTSFTDALNLAENRVQNARFF